MLSGKARETANGAAGVLVRAFRHRLLSACQLMTCVVGKQTGYLLGKTIKQQAFNEVVATREQSILFWPLHSAKCQPVDPQTLNESIVYCIG